MGRTKGRKIRGVILFCFVLSVLYGSPVKAIRNNPSTLAPISKACFAPAVQQNISQIYSFEALSYYPETGLQGTTSPTIHPTKFEYVEGAPGSVQKENLLVIDCPDNAGIITGASNICINGGTTTYTSTVPGGTWSSSRPAVASIHPTTGVVTALASGEGEEVTITYTIETAGCGTVTGTKNLTVDNVPTIDPIAKPGNICQGGVTGELDGLGKIKGGATGGIWSSPAGGTFNPDATTLNATWTPPASFAGDAILTLTTTGGACEAVSTSMVVTVNPEPTLNNATQLAVVCEGFGATINLTGLLPGSTSTINYTINGVAQAAVSGVVANASGVASFITVPLVAVNDGQKLKITGITVTSTTPACSGGFAMELTLNVDKKSGNPSSANATNTTICMGQSTVLTLNGGGGGTGEIIRWYSASCGGTLAGTGNGLSVSPTTTTTYFGRYEQGGPCNVHSACSQITVNVNSIPTAIAAPISQIICSGTNITTIGLTGAVSGTTYSWTRNNGTNVTGISTSGAGDINGALINTTAVQQTVKFTITPTADGCTGTPVEATVDVYPTLSSVISVNGNSSICSGQTAEVWISFTGSGPFKYTLNNGIEKTATGNPEKLTVSPSSTTTYVVTSLSGSNNCTAQASDRTGAAVVTILPLPALTSPFVTSACSGNVFSYTPEMSIPGSTYKWVRAAVTGVSNLPAEGTGPINEILTNTTNAPIDVVYRFELTSPNPQACTNIQNVVVTVNPIPAFTVSADHLRACVGTPITLSATPGSLSGYTYSLTYIPDGSNIYPVLPTFENNAIGSFVVYPIVGKHTYRLTATNSQGCSVSKEIQVKVFDIPVITIIPSCSEQSVTMNGTMVGTSSNPSNFTGSDLGVIEYSYDNGATWRTTTYWGPNLPLGVFAVLARNSAATDIYPTCTTSISAQITLTSVLTENVSVCQGLPAPSFSAVALCSGWSSSSQINNLNPSSSHTYRVSSSASSPYTQGPLVAFLAGEIFTVDKNNPQITFNDCNAKKDVTFSYSIYEYPFNPSNPAKGFVQLVADACPNVTIVLNPNKYYQLVINDYDINSNDESSIKFNGNDRIQVLNNTTEIVSWYKADGTFIQSSNTFNPVPAIIPDTNTPGQWKFYAACGVSNCRQEVNFTVDPIPTGSALGSNLVVTCSSQETNIQLKSVDLFGIPVPAGSVSYTWTTSIAAQDPSKVTITNNTCTSGCSEIIRETVTNSGTTTAIVDFTITPKGGDCVGQDFHVYLSVEPMPHFSITNTNGVICPSANPVIVPIEVVSLNSNLISGLQYLWNRTNTTNLPATADGSVPATGVGNANGFTISGTLESLFPKSLQTTVFTVEAQVNAHTCVTKSTSVTVGDEVAPVISCPAASLSFDCISKLPAAATDYNSFVAMGGIATDNCTAQPVVTHVGDVSLSGTNCSGVIRRTYRARDYAGNYSECYQDITIVNNTLPTFTMKPPAAFDRCVYDISVAIFDPLTEDLKPNIDLSPARPDYYRLTPEDKAALSNITHNGQCNIALHWKIVDSSGNPIRDENSDLLQDKTDALSSHPIKLNGAEATDVTYRLVYWLMDGCGNKAAEDQVIITIKPRPIITKI